MSKIHLRIHRLLIAAIMAPLRRDVILTLMPLEHSAQQLLHLAQGACASSSLKKSDQPETISSGTYRTSTF